MALKHLPENSRGEAWAWNLQLGVPGFKYADLNRVRRLEALDRMFLAQLEEAAPVLAEELRAYRGSQGADRGRLQESELLILVAPHIGTFVSRLFNIEDEYRALCARIQSEQIIFKWKRQFLERRIFKNPPAPEALARVDLVELEFGYREVVDALMPDASLTADPERELAGVCTSVQEASDAVTDPEERASVQ